MPSPSTPLTYKERRQLAFAIQAHTFPDADPQLVQNITEWAWDLAEVSDGCLQGLAEKANG